MECIEYRDGYKYQITKEYKTQIPIQPPENIVSPTEFIKLSKEGELTLKKGYAWDGPSGPTVDTLDFMRGSLVHDALYQLMREGLLDRKQYRDPADRLIEKMCREDGMHYLRAKWVYMALKYFGEKASHPNNLKPKIPAPKACRI